jgi:hypothetical protein
MSSGGQTIPRVTQHELSHHPQPVWLVRNSSWSPTWNQVLPKEFWSLNWVNCISALSRWLLSLHLIKDGGFGDTCFLPGGPERRRKGLGREAKAVGFTGLSLFIPFSPKFSLRPVYSYPPLSMICLHSLARAAMIGQLTQQKFIVSPLWRLWVQNQGVSKVAPPEASLWLIDGSFSSVCVCDLNTSFCKDPNQIRWRPIHMSSFYLKELFKDPAPQNSYFLRFWRLELQLLSFEEIEFSSQHTLILSDSSFWLKCLWVG